MTNWEVLLEPAKVVLSQIGQFIGKTLGVVIILIIGWVIAKVIKTLVIKGLKAIKIVDIISERIELNSILAKGGIEYSLSELVGVICYWLMLLITFVVAINFLGLTVAADLLNRIVLYIPNVIAGIFILILGIFIATLLKNIVQTAANNMGISQANLLAKVTEIVIIAFSIFITLEQLKIGIRITEITLSIILGSIGLGLALAFGLGCKDIVADYVEELLNKMKKK